jgi:glycosyltransferase involved in cell wall biosynthesis
MAGPDQTSLLPRLQAMAAAASVADRVSWPGMLQGDMKWGAFYASEVFALPSHQENFGIAVAEALGCGLPVLISDKVNTWREIDELRSGLVGADTAAGVERLLRDWLALSGAERSGFANQARSTFTARFSVDAMASDLIAATQALNTVVQAHGLRRFDPTS